MGTFTIGETKIRPGEYHRVENGGGVSIVGATNGIVAGVIQANWGPLNEVVEFLPSTNIKQVYGSGTGMTQAMIFPMFLDGAVRGYFVRCGSGGTSGNITLKDSATEAANAVTISAKYVGSRAFTVTIRDSITNTSKRECIIYDGTSEFEKITFAKGSGEPAALVAAFANSKNFTATKVADGNGTLAAVTQSAFTAGTDPTVNTEAYSTALEALEPYTFNVICVDSETSAVHAVVEAFVNRTYAAGKYPMAVLSESKSVSNTVAVRMQHGAAFNNAKIIYVLNSGTDADGNAITGYMNAARIGGIIATVPSNQSVTHYVVSGYSDLAETLTNTQIEAALQSGCLVLSKNSTGQVWIEQGINTLVTPSADEDAGWKKIRRVKARFEIMQRIGDTVENLVGKVNNDNNGRAAVIAAGQNIINTMIAENKIISGTMTEDETNPAQGDSAWFVIAVDDLDSIEKLYITYRFRFAPDE